MALPCLITLAGCTTSASSLPALSPAGNVSSTATVPSDLEVVATAIYNCLSDADLPVVYHKDPEGRSTLIRFDESIPAWWSLPSGDTEWTGALSQSELASMASGLGPSLIINGEDQTAIWAACIEQTGFDDDLVWAQYDTGPREEAWQALVVEASNQWAECARNNGFPTVVDAQLPTSEEDTPAAVLPSHITEEQLRALLDICPNFDPDIEKQNEAMRQYVQENGWPEDQPVPDGVRAQPSVTIETSVFVNGQSLSPDEIAELERSHRLGEILFQAQIDYYAQR
jgi:hypothetical protein